MPTIRLRTDAPGYILEGAAVNGFPDDPSLSDAQRTTVARWASRFGAASPKQLQLLERAPRRQASARQQALLRNQDDMARLAATGVWDALTETEQGWVIRPSSHPELPATAEYPLSTGQLRAATGASERQLRHWIDQNLIPAGREGKARHVYSAGLAQALLLCRVEQQEKTVLARIASGDAHALYPLIAAVLLDRSEHSAGVAVAVSALSRLGDQAGESDSRKSISGSPVFVSASRADEPEIGRIVLDPTLTGLVVGGGSIELPLKGLITDEDVLHRAASENTGVVVIIDGLDGGAGLVTALFGGPTRPPNVWNVVKGEGGWDVVEPGAGTPSATTSTQAEAWTQAKEIVQNAGGGEVRVHRPNGVLRYSRRVEGKPGRRRKSSPRGAIR